MKPAAFLVLFAAAFAQQEKNANKRIVCYYTNWSSYRPGSAVFVPRNINPFLCTHIIYAFTAFDADNDDMKAFDEYQDITRKGFQEFSEVKAFNENLKTLAAIGGWREGSATFSSIAASEQRRKSFAKNSIRFLRKHKFDGINLDWQFPGFREGGKPEDFENFVTLLKTLRDAFDAEPDVTEDSRLLLTMSVPSNTEYIDGGFDLVNLQLHADFITVLCYDYHFSTDPFVNHHAPIYALPSEIQDDDPNVQLNIDWTVKYILDKGVQPEKLVLGIPAYGRTYKLEDESMHQLGSPAEGQGDSGVSTREVGYKAFYEICTDILNDGWTVVHVNKTALGPYAYKGKDWVAYDDEESARRKGEYARDHGLGGIMFWTIDDDDFRGECGSRGNPLIKAAREGFYSPPAVMKMPKVTPMKPATTKAPVSKVTKTVIMKKITTAQPPRAMPSVDKLAVPGEEDPVIEAQEPDPPTRKPVKRRKTVRPQRPKVQPPPVIEYEIEDDEAPPAPLAPATGVGVPKPMISFTRTTKDGEKTLYQTISIWIINNIFHLGMKSKESSDQDISLSI